MIKNNDGKMSTQPSVTEKQV